MTKSKKAPHILLVDNDPLILRVFSSLFASSGFEVLQAHDGNEGREMARRLQPDLIMLDLRMPVMDGTEVLMRIKEESQTKDIPVCIFTNEDLSIEAEQKLKELGADAYICKSEEPKKVMELVHKLLEVKK